MKTFLALTGISALGLSVGAAAQTVAPPKSPASDINCQFPNNSAANPAGCTVMGTRTTIPTTGTATAEGGNTRLNGQWNVNFNGTLQTDGIPVVTMAGQPPFSFDAQSFFSDPGPVINVTSSYTGQYNNVLALGTIAANNIGYFQQYLNPTTTINSFNVNTTGEVTDAGTGQEFNFRLNTPAPTTIIGGNTVNLGGVYSSVGDEGTNAIVFGRLSGTAQLTGAGLSSAAPFGFNNAGWFSPYGVQYNITATETTKLDETGLITPTVSVSAGINMNGSKVTNLATGTTSTDGVNVGQLIVALTQAAASDFLAVSSTGAQPVAAAANTVALGPNAQATVVNAVALGVGARAFAANDLAIGTGALANGGNAFAVGTSSESSSNGGIAFGNASFAGGGANALAFGFASQATAANTTTVGAFSRAQAAGATAIGNNAAATHANATAIGFNAATTRANQLVLGAAGTSVTVADIAASDAAQVGVESLLTIDSSGTIGTRPNSGQAFIEQANSQIADLQQGQAAIDDLVAAQTNQIAALGRGQTQAEGGIAAAMAMGGMMVVPDSKISMNFNLSTYRGQQGFAGGVAARVSRRVYVSGGFAGSTVKRSTGGRVGMAIGF